MRRRSKVEDEIEIASVARTLQAIDQAHVVIFMVDAHDLIGDQDASVLGLALKRGRALIIAVNKWDGIPLEQREEIRRQLGLKLDFVPFAPVHFISALHGTAVGVVMSDTIRAYEAAMRDMPTPALTKALERAIQQHQPPLVRGRRIKLRYAHQGGRNPPRVIVHGNQVASVPEAYSRYLANTYRKTFDLFATPVSIEFRQDKNPFARAAVRPSLRQRPVKKGSGKRPSPKAQAVASGKAPTRGKRSLGGKSPATRKGASSGKGTASGKRSGRAKPQR